MTELKLNVRSLYQPQWIGEVGNLTSHHKPNQHRDARPARVSTTWKEREEADCQKGRGYSSRACPSYITRCALSSCADRP